MRNLSLLFVVGLATGFLSEKFFVSSQSPISTPDDLYLEGRTSGDVPIDDEDGQDDGSGSGSGDYNLGVTSDEEILRRISNISKTTISKEMVPVQPQPTADSPQNPETTAAGSQDETTTGKTPLYIFPDVDNEDKEVKDIGPTADWFTESTSPISTSINEDSEDNSLTRWDISTPKDTKEGVSLEELDNEIIPSDDRGSRRYSMDFPEEVTSENVWERTGVLAAVIACGVIGFLCAVFLLLLLGYRMKKKDEGSYELGDSKLSTTAYHKAPTKEFYA
ncbi:syndecan-2-like [Mastacembelus armatus]|uniref:Syndecan n=1 Tax=Mastacembelus armatus TaxID=205130 RepID=A0A3Q3T3S0_9TELE|nr:syndecan-2-like [Mastacembelus armatus]